MSTLEQAAAAVGDTGGGVVVDVVPGRDDPTTVDETVVELGDLLGYVRVPAHALTHAAAPGLLATLPPQVPVAIGAGGADDAPRPEVPTDVPAQIARATAMRAAVDAMLRHPHAAGR